MTQCWSYHGTSGQHDTSLHCRGPVTTEQSRLPTSPEFGELQGMECGAGARLSHADTQHCWCEAAPDCCAVWPAAACHRRGDRPSSVYCCAPVWELMGNCFDTLNYFFRININIVSQLSYLTVDWLQTSYLTLYWMLQKVAIFTR